MGLWDAVRKAIADRFDTAGQLEDPAVRARMREHRDALLAIDPDWGSDRLLGRLMASAARHGMRSDYLGRLPDRDVRLLHRYLAGQADRARRGADADRLDQAAAAQASRLEALARFVKGYRRNRGSDD